MEQGKLLLLGTGASAGIPVIGCECVVCRSDNRKNQRLRASALLQLNGKNFLIDAGPDIRQQALKFGISHLDGLFLTHTHYDHIGGLEELRVFNFRQKAPISALLSKESLHEVKKLFHYIFEEHTKDKTLPAQIHFTVLPHERGEVEFCGVKLRYFSYTQSKMKVTGYRFGDLAYVTDIKEYPETIFQDLQGVSTLIISALRFTSSHLQFAVDDAIDFAKRVQPQKTYLIHMAHEIEHDHLSSILPETIQVAYDGLEIPFAMRNE